MSKRIILGLLAALFMGQPAGAQSVFSPSVNGLRSSYTMRRAASPDADKERIGVVVTCSRDASAAAIANKMIEYGAAIRVLIANQLVAEVPMARLDDIAAIEGVLLIDHPEKGSRKTDTARKAANVDEAHAGKMSGMADLAHAYTGEGVIIGLIDGGFDFTHPMFKDKDNNLRIKGVYQPDKVDKKHLDKAEKLVDIPVTDDKGITTKLNLTGSFFTVPEVILDTTIVRDTTDSHGTHCASIAAGRMMDYTSTFKAKSDTHGRVGGMAPGAWLMLAQNETSDDQQEIYPPGTDMEFVNSMQALWAMKYFADKMGKPLVISWSENRHTGFHDGTSSMARLIGNFCDAGNIMALCASNEGSTKEYLSEKITKGSTLEIACPTRTYANKATCLLRTDAELKIDLAVVDQNFKPVYKLNLPLTTAKYAVGYQNLFKCQVKNGKVEVNEDYYKTLGDKLHKDYLKNGRVAVTSEVGSGLDKNDKPFTYTQIDLSTSELTMYDIPGTSDEYVLMLMISSPNADVDIQVWSEGFNMGYSLSTDPHNFKIAKEGYSVGDWNTSGKPVTIGAYCTDRKYLGRNSDTGKLEWKDDDNERLGKCASFSSYGYDFSDAKRAYPDVSAPGVNIYAASNSFAPDKEVMVASYENQYKGQTTARDYPYTTQSGTSMSTPAAAGIIALWVQAAKEKGKPLTNEYIKEIIKNSSDTDDYTTIAPLRYGAGKINAYKGLLYVLDLATAIPELPTRHIGARLDGRTLYIDGNPDTQVTIYNLAGQKVLDARAEQGTIQLPSLPAGVYAVKIGSQGSTLIRL